jgi:hypothetical protein
MKPCILLSMATWRPQLLAESLDLVANITNSPDGRNVARVPRFRRIGTRTAICKFIQMSLTKFPPAGYHHYLAAGRREGRLGGLQPAEWNEADYLAANPDARARVALGIYRSGYLHYAAIGKRQGRLGGFPADSATDELLLRWPALNHRLFQLEDLFRMVFSTTAVRDAVATIFGQSEPADFDDAGMRVWHDHDAIMRKLGGSGAQFHRRLRGGDWRPWLVPPKFVYCFADPETGVSSFDPFRFMLRHSYAEGTYCL